ncbi:MAG: DUF4445 domain-containing protein [Spirochaetes bacterium]|nr:DUF4445 domain-containing protein [Spirochaetota bacterium]
MCRVNIQPGNLIFHAEKDTPLRDFLIREGILIDFPCGGRGLCRQCKVKIDPPPGSGTGERKKLAEEELKNGIRLACQAVIEGNCTVTIPESGRVNIAWEGAATTGAEPLIPGEPLIKKIHIKLPEPSLKDQRSDWTRVQEELSKRSIPIEKPAVSSLENMSSALRRYNWDADIILDDKTFIGVEKRGSEPLYGFAVDLGTTTVDISLHHLETGGRIIRKTLLNRQVSFGADVISRAQQFGTSREKVRNAALDTINQGARTILEETGIPAEKIYRTVIVGNPIMLHILINFDPYQLTQAPYIPVISDSLKIPPDYFGWNFQKHGWVETLPVISAFVGADTVGMIIAMNIDREKITSLSIDIGTNGEIVLSDKGNIVTTSTAAGPAFEGAQIACGMRAVKGAVYSVSIDAEENQNRQVSYRTIGRGKPSGICGTGLISAVAALLNTGLIDNTGRLLPAEEITCQAFKSRIFKINDKPAFAVTEDKTVYITQKDIRELQLAKGAIRTGVESLLDKAGITIDKLDLIRLAGNFGAGIDVEAAIRIGLIPPADKSKVDAVGNAALRGAVMVLVSKTARDRAGIIAEKSSFLELAGKPEFQMRFAESMFF